MSDPNWARPMITKLSKTNGEDPGRHKYSFPPQIESIETVKNLAPTVRMERKGAGKRLSIDLSSLSEDLSS